MKLLPVPLLDVSCCFTSVYQKYFLLSQHDLCAILQYKLKHFLTRKYTFLLNNPLWRFFSLEDTFCPLCSFSLIWFNMYLYNSGWSNGPTAISIFNTKSKWIGSTLYWEARDISVLEIIAQIQIFDSADWISFDDFTERSF